MKSSWFLKWPFHAAAENQCQKVPHLAVGTERVWTACSLYKNHCSLSIRNKRKRIKKRKKHSTVAKDSIKEIWDNSLNTLHDCWAHWSHSRGAPSVVKMCLVPGGSLCLSHVTNISIAEYHKFVETKSQWLSFCTLFCPECHLSRWFMRWTLAMQVFFPSEWRNNPEKKRISFELIEEAALSLIH